MKNTSRRIHFFGEGAQQGYCSPESTFFWKLAGEDHGGQRTQGGSAAKETKTLRIGALAEIRILFEWKAMK